VKYALFAAFVGTVIAANWALGRYGIVPIGFGLAAPAGVYFAGLAFGLRDALHERGGRTWVLAAIGVGAGVSLVVEDAVTVPGGYAPIAVASAVVASNVVGAVIDSALFLWLAFGSLDHLVGNTVGKVYMIAVALPIVWYARRAVSRNPVHTAGS
jgi:uncharacterized PurR-regulated membrane protein YhhQ (DUF165 family)